MFQHIQNHSANLLNSEKLYYDNYDYYNVYQNLEKDYKDDLSKMIFHCNRKSTPTIIVYNQNPKHMRTIHHRYIHTSETFKQFYDNHYQMHQHQYSHNSDHLTMQQFLQIFLDPLLENTYSQGSASFCVPSSNSNSQNISTSVFKQHNQEYQIISLGRINDYRYRQASYVDNTGYEGRCPFSMQLPSKQNLLQLLGKLTLSSTEKIEWLQEQYQKQNNIGVFNLQCQVAFQMFANHVLTKKYQSQNSTDFQLLYEYIVEVNRIMWEILNSRMRSVLLLAQPKCKYIHYLVHPLILPIAKFLEYNHNQFTNPKQRLLTAVSTINKPKIVLINLDGRQSAHNLRNVRILGQNILYISIYNEMSWIERKSQQMENLFASEEEENQTNFENLCNLYSQFIIEEYVTGTQLQSSKQIDPNILLFPLNSSFLHKKYNEMKRGSAEIADELKRYPNMESPIDVLFLFETIIYERIRSFGPTMIFVSYNGQLQQLNKSSYKGSTLGPNGTQVFSDIIRNCSIICDHRVILFPNFVNLFKYSSTSLQEDESNNFQQEQSDIEDDDGKIKCVRQFYAKYYQYRLDDVLYNAKTKMGSINIQTIHHQHVSKLAKTVKKQPLFQAISLFLKYAPGGYNMRDGLSWQQCPTWKYRMANRYGYLWVLDNIGQFSFIQNCIPNKISPSQLQELYSLYGAEQIRQNNKQNQYYDKLITSVISEFLCESIKDDQLKAMLENRLYYRLQAKILELVTTTLQTQQQQINARLLLQAHFNDIKQEMLLQNMQNYKTRKHYYIPEGGNQQGDQNIQCIKFVHKNTNKSNQFQQSQTKSNQKPQASINYTNTLGQQLLIQKYTQILINQPSSLNMHNSYGQAYSDYNSSSGLKSSVGTSTMLGNNPPSSSVSSIPYSTVFLINYRSESNRHMIMVGNINQQKAVQMEEVQETDREMSEQIIQYFQSHYITEEGHPAQKQDIVYLNYNHCFCGNTLYLYWPLQYNLKEQVRCRMLGVEYFPKRVFKMLKIAPVLDSVNNNQNKIVYKYEKVVYQPHNDQKFIECLPRWGCTSYAIDEKTFMIFGGIFQSELDYMCLSTNISMIEVADNYMSFTIKCRPKTQRNRVQCSLKPKIGYKINQNFEQQSLGDFNKMQTGQNSPQLINYNSKKIKVSCGYGRYNTNSCNLFSYEEYWIDIDRLIPTKTECPAGKFIFTDRNQNNGSSEMISWNSIGKYTVKADHAKNIKHTQQRFNDTVKHRFVFQINKSDNIVGMNNNSILSNNTNNNANKQNSQLVSFIDDNYQVCQFKTDQKKLYLFGYMQTIREKIYAKCWSPQLYIITQSNTTVNNTYPLIGSTPKVNFLKPHIVNLCLKTQKNTAFIMKNYLMPREQDIMCLCLEQDHLYLISNCSILHNLQSASTNQYSQLNVSSPQNKFVLYQGSLNNMNQLLQKKQIHMNNKYTFSNFDCDKYMRQKSMFVHEEQIYVVGGLAVASIQSQLAFKGTQHRTQQQQVIYQRHDYILKELKNRYVIKTKKLLLPKEGLDMPNCVVVKQRQSYFLYSIVLQEHTITGQMDEQQKQCQLLKLKIQQHSFDNNQSQCTVKVGQFKVYFHNDADKQIQRYPSSYLEEPKFVSITPYQRFSIKNIKPVLSKALWNFNIFLGPLYENNQPQQLSSEQAQLTKLIGIIQSIISTDEYTDQQTQQLLINHVNVIEQIMKILLNNSNTNIFKKTTGIQQNNTSVNSRGYQQNSQHQFEQLLKDLRHCYHLIYKLILQRSIYLQPNTSQTQQYRFILQDKTSRKVKYIAINSLNTTRMLFFRIRFSHELNLCMNYGDDNGFYYHPSIIQCMRFESERIKNNKSSDSVNIWEKQYKISQIYHKGA